MALVGSSVALIESILAQTFRVKVFGEYRGGPAYYMSRGMKNKKVGKVFGMAYAIVTVIGVAFLMSSVQAYTLHMDLKMQLEVRTSFLELPWQR